MKDVVVDGGSDHYKKHNRASVFDYIQLDSTFNETYNSAMAGISTLVMTKKILKVYNGFDGLKFLVGVVRVRF